MKDTKEVTICSHRVNLWLEDSEVLSLECQKTLFEKAEERAKTQIIEGYIEGELNEIINDVEFYGYWSIKK